MKPNLADRTCELLKWLCNYRKLHNTTTREQFWQYSLLLLTKPQLRCGQMEFEGDDDQSSPWICVVDPIKWSSSPQFHPRSDNAPNIWQHAMQNLSEWLTTARLLLLPTLHQTEWGRGTVVRGCLRMKSFLVYISVCSFLYKKTNTYSERIGMKFLAPDHIGPHTDPCLRDYKMTSNLRHVV